MKSMTSKRVVVIGGSSGIGLATVQAAVAAGAQVIIAARTLEKLERAQREIGHGVETAVLDMSQEDQIPRLLSGARADRPSGDTRRIQLWRGNPVPRYLCRPAEFCRQVLGAVLCLQVRGLTDPSGWLYHPRLRAAQPKTEQRRCDHRFREQRGRGSWAGACRGTGADPGEHLFPRAHGHAALRRLYGAREGGGYRGGDRLPNGQPIHDRTHVARGRWAYAQIAPKNKE